MLALVLGFWPRDRGRFPRRRAAVLACTVLALTAFKFITMDVPLARISNLVVRTGSAPSGEDPSAIPTLFGQGADFSALVAGLTSERRKVLRSFIVCSRIGPHAVASDTVLRARFSCNADQTKDHQSLQDEFVAQLVAGLLIACFAGMLLQLSRGKPGNVLGILSLVYLLTLPYGYGKLIKSTQFDYGRVYPAETLTKATELPSLDTGRVDTAKPAKGSATVTSPPRYFNALVVSRSPVASNLLVVQRGACPSGAPDASGLEARYSVVKMSSISASQVLSVEEIYRDDAITWALLNERPCPRAPSVFSPGRVIR